MLTNIICATDGSDHGGRALEYARRLATAQGGQLHVVHVVEKAIGGRMGGGDARVDEPDRSEHLAAEIAKLKAAGVAVTLDTPVAPAGEAGRITAEIAKDNDADVIVVGSRGHSALVGAVLGSVTRALLHAAHCPVLVIPRDYVPADEPEPKAGTAAG